MTSTQLSAACWQAASFGANGFYRNSDLVIRQHFRTSCQVGGPLITTIVARILATDALLGYPSSLDVIDVGAGDGDLITSLWSHLHDQHPDVAARATFVAIDCRARPSNVPSAISWINGFAPAALPRHIRGLVFAFELLDEVPVDDRVPNARIDLAHAMCSAVQTGQVLFVDYADQPDEESEVVGFRNGEMAPVRSDGSMNISRSVDFHQLTISLAEQYAVAVTNQDAAIDRQFTSGAGLATLKWECDLAELTAVPGLGEHKWLTVTVTEHADE